MKLVRLILALGAFFVAAAALAGCGESSVAEVAGVPIPTRAFDHWMFIAAKGNSAQSPGAPVIVPNDPPNFKSCIAQARKQIPTLAKTPEKQLRADCAQLFQSLNSQVMDFLIRSYWYQAEAAKHHITVSDAQVKQAFQTEKRQQLPNDAAFKQFLAQSGQTMEDILYRVRINQLLKKLLAQHNTPVNATTIRAYYNSHRPQFGTPETRDVELVRTNQPGQANAVRSALQSGQSWKDVAKRFSVDTATKNKGGVLKGIARGQEEQAFDRAAFAAPLNQLQGPVHGTFGYYVFQVTKVKKATQQSLAQATPLIRQILQSQGQQTSQSALDAQVKRNWQNQTSCSSAFAIALCHNYKPPANSTNPLSPTGPSTAPPPSQSAPPPSTTP